MTTINNQGFYCCLCFEKLTDETCSVVNGQKCDVCVPCITKEHQVIQELLRFLRKENQELKLVIERLTNEK